MIRPRTPAQAAVYDWLLANGPAHLSYVAEALGISENAVYFRLRELVKTGHVQRHGRHQWAAARVG